MIRTENMSVRGGDFLVGGVDLHVAPGEYFVLLGPTGSGKTLLMTCICGLRRVVAGRIYIDGRDVTDLEPRLRRVGYVPQDAGLFPHMTVAQNVMFALRSRGVGRHRALEEVAPLVETIGLGPLMGRGTRGLSGGERQMVALARALAGRPKVLLLDEPVSALDEMTRRHICGELRRVQRQFGVATIHICHSREEAFSVADRLGIMHEGGLAQVGEMEELLNRPATEPVARLLGAENIFTGRARPAEGGGAHIAFAGHEISTPLRYEGDVRFMVRPERLRVSAGDPPADNCIQAVLRSVAHHGAYVRLELDAAVPVVVFASPASPARGLAVGGHCAVHFPPDAVHVIPR